MKVTIRRAGVFGWLAVVNEGLRYWYVVKGTRAGALREAEELVRLLVDGPW